MKKLTFASLFAACLLLSFSPADAATATATATSTATATTAALVPSHDGVRILNNDIQCEGGINPLDSISTSTSISESSNDNGYSAWLTSRVSSVEYENHLYVATKSDKCNGMAFHWNIVNNEKIQIAVAVKLDTSNGNGWVGIGFSETGGMRGADIVYFESSSMTLTDAHVDDGYVKPTVDGVQDWTLLHGEKTTDGYLIFEAERKLVLEETDVHEDYNIVDDSDILVVDHKIIGSWGSGGSISYHGKNVIQQSVQLFATDDSTAGNGYERFKSDMERRADGHAYLKVNDYIIPSVETTYEDFCFTVEDLVQLGLYETINSSTHIIGFEFVIGGENVRKYVHHMLVEGHLTDLNEDGDRCRFRSKRTIAGWAPGEDVFYFPEGMGLEIGNVAGSLNSITLQIHYDNVDGDENEVDDGTGVKIYYTNQPVEHEIGMIIMGDGLVILDKVPIGNGKTRHDITCPSSCTEEVFDDDEVTVILESHHMHAAGRRQVSHLFRPSGGDNDSDVLVNKATANYWDFDQSGITLVRQKPYKWKRGDYFTTTCYFESYDDATFGLESSQEMCMTFLYYYPKQRRLTNCSPFFSFEESCVAEYSTKELEPNSNFNREFIQRFEVEPDTIGDGEDSDDPNASATLSVHGVVLSMILLVGPLVTWLQG